MCLDIKHQKVHAIFKRCKSARIHQHTTEYEGGPWNQSLDVKMPQFVVTRKVNDTEYYLQDVLGSKVVWISDWEKAISFDTEDELHEFLRQEFAGKDYYSTEHRDEDDWGIIIKPKGIF